MCWLLCSTNTYWQPPGMCLSTLHISAGSKGAIGASMHRPYKKASERDRQTLAKVVCWAQATNPGRWTRGGWGVTFPCRYYEIETNKSKLFGNMMQKFIMKLTSSMLDCPLSPVNISRHGIHGKGAIPKTTPLLDPSTTSKCECEGTYQNNHMQTVQITATTLPVL